MEASCIWTDWVCEQSGAVGLLLFRIGRIVCSGTTSVAGVQLTWDCWGLCGGGGHMVARKEGFS